MKRIGHAACLTIAIVAGLSVSGSQAGEIDARLDEILQGSATGIVRIEVLRPWSGPFGEAVGGENGPPVQRIQGSGIVWGDGREIITVSDLAQPGDTLFIRGSGGTSARAEYVTQDSDLGLSVIRAMGETTLDPIPIGESAPLKSHGWVLVVGYQTNGANRQLAVNRVRAMFRRGESWMARLDAVPEAGLSGGGVLDSDGKLIGMLLGEGSESLLLSAPSKRSKLEYCIGAKGPSQAGWVLPIELIQTKLDSIRDAGFHRAGFLGVRAHLPEEGLRKTSASGIRIAEVIPGSPADQAGLRAGDRIVLFHGDRLQDWEDLTRRVTATLPDQIIEIEFERNGRSHTATLTLADRAHVLWKERQMRIAGGRERMLRRQIEGLQQELELVRHQLAFYR